MLKKEIISLIINLLPKEDKVEKYHKRVVIAAIQDVLREMYLELYKTNPRLVDGFTKVYGASTPIAVAQEAITGIYYSTLPSTIVELPCKQSGVRHILPVVNTGNVFQPMDSTEADLIFNTDVAVVTDKIGFRVRQDSRVDYWNMNPTIPSVGVRMELLIPFSEYLETDIVHIPEFAQKQGGSFVQRVLALLTGIPPVDLIDNNAEAEKTYSKKQ